MSLFDNMLKDGESLFVDPLPLDLEFIPPIIEGRETEQEQISTAIKPLFYKRPGKQILITGAPGIGKTIATKYVLSELNKETQDIATIYINCWKKDTPHKIALEICDQIGFKFTHNRDTTDLFKEIAKILNKKSAVIVLDECDKITDQQLFYTLIEEIYRKTLILITNDSTWLSRLDTRVRSRLTPEILSFTAYNAVEVSKILRKRVEFAFAPQVFDDEAFELVATKAHEVGDIRAGLYLLKEAGEIAEYNAAKKITQDHAHEAIKKVQEVQIKSTAPLDATETKLLEIIKSNTGKTTKQIHELYQSGGGTQSYSNFHKKIKHLEKGSFITLEEKNEGPGKSTFVHYGNKQFTTS